MKAHRYLFALSLICSVALADPIKDPSFEKFKKGGKMTQLGVCIIGEVNHPCAVLNKNDIEYLIVYKKEDGSPQLAMTRVSKRVVWVAGTKI